MNTQDQYFIFPRKSFTFFTFYKSTFLKKVLY
jgi:hypothetical protein